MSGQGYFRVVELVLVVQVVGIGMENKLRLVADMQHAQVIWYAE